MKLRRATPSTIFVPEVRVTARFDEETWQQFESSIKELGPVAPVICCEMAPEKLHTGEGEEKVPEQYVQSNGKVLVLVDGLHRLYEAQKNGTEKIDVAVIEGDMVDVLTKNLFLDHMRGKTPPSEMVKVIEALWKEFGMDSEAIAAKTGLTRDYVEKLQLISQLTPACRAALDDGKIGIGHAAALTKIKDPVRQETVLNQLLLYHWPVKELEEYIKSILEIIQEREAAPGPAAPPAPPKIKCVFCGGEYDLSEIANPPTCRGCSGTLFAAIAQAKAEAAAEAAAKEAADRHQD